MAKQHKEKNVTEVFSKPSRKEAEEAVKTLIKWAGDNLKEKVYLILKKSC